MIYESQTVLMEPVDDWANQNQPSRFLTGLIECGQCGHPVVAVGSLYRCASACTHTPTTCAAVSVSADALEGVVVEAISEQLLRPASLELIRKETERVVGLQSLQEVGSEKVTATIRGAIAALPHLLRVDYQQARSALRDCLAHAKLTVENGELSVQLGNGHAAVLVSSSNT